MKEKRLAMLTSVLMGLAGLAYGGAHGGEQAYQQFSVDPAHSDIGFSVRHLGVVNVRGAFNDYEATLKVRDYELATLQFEMTIQATSIDTGVGARDDHLRTADYFEVETYPEITFVSTRVKRYGTGQAVVGELTIKGVTKEVTLAAVLNGPVSDPWGNTRIGLELSGEINRHDFGVAHDALSDRSIGDTVRIDVQIQAIQQ